MSADIFTQIAARDAYWNIRCGLTEKLLEFAKIHIRGAMLDRDHTRGMAALVELRRVYVGLSTVYPEYERQVEEMDAGLDRILHATRSSLMKNYVRCQDPAEVMEISETLSECIAADREWDWGAEFDKALADQVAS
jgi:hypothetical protein